MIQALKRKCNFLCCLGTLLGSHKRTYMHEFVIFKLWTSKVRFPFLIFFCLISLFITYVFKKMFSIALCDSFLFLIMQSRQVKGGVREARYISEAVVMGSGYLKKLVKSSWRVLFSSWKNTFWVWRLFSKACSANIDYIFWGIFSNRLFVKCFKQELQSIEWRMKFKFYQVVQP